MLTFPSAPRLLELEGYTLIAWRLGAEGPAVETNDWYHALYRPADGKGWYQSGHYHPPVSSAIAPHGEWPERLSHDRMSRANALWTWRYQFKNPLYAWHHLMSEAQAFPARHLRYLRPPRERAPIGALS